MYKFLTVLFAILVTGVMVVPPIQAKTLVKFGEAFGMPTPFSVDSATGNPTRNVVRGVPAALQPWWVKRGEAKVKTNGTISARVEYLVFAGGDAIGTNGPISKVILTLFCGSTEYSTEPVALKPEGMIRVRHALLMPPPPDTCENPALLVRIANPVMPWIAAFAPEVEEVEESEDED